MLPRESNVLGWRPELRLAISQNPVDYDYFKFSGILFDCLKKRRYVLIKISIRENTEDV